MKFLHSLMLVLAFTIPISAYGQSVLLEHDFESSVAGSLSGEGSIGQIAAGTIHATGGFISSQGKAYTSGNNGFWNRLLPDPFGDFDDVGNPAGNYLLGVCSSAASVSSELNNGEATVVNFSIGQFGSSDATNFKYIHVIGKDSFDQEVFQISFRCGSGFAATSRQLWARTIDQNSTTFFNDEFESIDGHLVLQGLTASTLSTTTSSQPEAMVDVTIVIEPGVWSVVAIPSSGEFELDAAKELPGNPVAANLKSIEFFSSHNVTVDDQNKGLWVDNLLVTTDRISDVQIAAGDTNQDGNIDLLDIADFIDAITEGIYLIEADINLDGQVDLLDIAPFVELLTSN